MKIVYRKKLKKNPKEILKITIVRKNVKILKC